MAFDFPLDIENPFQQFQFESIYADDAASLETRLNAFFTFICQTLGPTVAINGFDFAGAGAGTGFLATFSLDEFIDEEEQIPICLAKVFAIDCNIGGNDMRILEDFQHTPVNLATFITSCASLLAKRIGAFVEPVDGLFLVRALRVAGCNAGRRFVILALGDLILEEPPPTFTEAMRTAHAARLEKLRKRRETRNEFFGGPDGTKPVIRLAGGKPVIRGRAAPKRRK